VAPASSAFSISSFKTEHGLSRMALR
jgi:hypothetical protein